MRTSKYPHGCLTSLRVVRQMVREYLDAEAILEEQHRQDMEFRREEACKERQIAACYILLMILFWCIFLAGKELGTW